MQKDFVRDANPKPLYKAGSLASLPQYVKDYTLPSEEDVEKLASAAFADKQNRLHPIHTKEATILSGIYLEGVGLGNSKAMGNVKAAASVFGVLEDLESVLKDLSSSIEKSANDKSNNIGNEVYAITIEFDSEKTASFYPIGNDVQIRASAVALNNSLLEGKIPSDWAHTAAVSIVKAAKKAGLHDNDMPARIRRMGIERLVDFDHAKEAATLRQYDGVPTECVELYSDIVKAAEENPESVQECIKLWSDLDMTHNVKYASTFTPEEAFYAGERLDRLEKMATEVVLIQDVMVPVKEFASLADTRVNNNFRKEAAQTIREAIKLASVNVADATCKLASLDEENQSELLKLLAQD